MLEWAAQRGGGVTVPGGVQEMFRCWFSVELLVAGEWLDLFILKVFSYFGDSMIIHPDSLAQGREVNLVRMLLKAVLGQEAI